MLLELLAFANFHQSMSVEPVLANFLMSPTLLEFATVLHLKFILMVPVFVLILLCHQLQVALALLL